MPRRSIQQKSGYRGEAFVDKFVSDAGHIWNDKRRDFGIDGQIEFVDADGEVTGFALAAQVKGADQKFNGESSTSLRFTCKADRIDYWLRYGRPVVLICVNLAAQQAWWKRVDTWFADPHRRMRRVVEFDKATDRLDPDSFSVLSSMGVPAGQPLPRLERAETLVSNLLVVDRFAPVIYEAASACENREEAWERMRSNGAYESGFHIHGGRIYSLAPLDVGPLSVLCAGPVTSIPSDKWSTSFSADIQRKFVALLNFTLRSMRHPDLVWHPRKKIVYYQASTDLSARKVRGRYKNAKGRGFFYPVKSKKEPGKISNYRHYAAQLYFRRWSDTWYLEINPTYHFTIDGKRESPYDAEGIKNMKLLERNNAVFQLVRAWADYLKGDVNLLTDGDNRIEFGDLTLIEADAAIDERVWIPPKLDDDGDEQAGSVQGLWGDEQ